MKGVLFFFCYLFGSFWRMLTYKAPDDEPAAAIIVNVIGHPVNKYDNPVARAYQ